MATAPNAAPAPLRLALPPLVFGTSALGNLYRAMPEADRLAVIAACRERATTLVLDSAGKYGAGLALEAIGRGLRALAVPPEDVLINVKLGWLRVPLTGPEPTFEPGAWVDLAHDAALDLSAAGVERCWTQACELLGAPYRPRLVSLHDPDEWLAQAGSPDERARRFDELVASCARLEALRRRGEVAAIGVGAKDWRVVRDLCARVDLDWVMLACDFSIHRHAPEVVELIAGLRRRGIAVIASAVFNGGFLVGGPFYDYRRADAVADRGLFAWREAFEAACRDFAVAPAAACVRFARSAPGIAAIALNATSPRRVAEHVAIMDAAIPDAFWRRLKDERLIRADYPHLGR